MLDDFRGSAALVLAIPAGGVPVGAAIAEALGLPLALAPVSKVLYPWTTESGYGAVAFDGSVWLDEARMAGHGLTPTQVERAIAEARAKIERRLALFSAVPLGVEGRTVMLVDDVNIAALSLAAAFFFVELVVAPIWAVPMDIAPRYSGSASGMMNFGFGVAGIISPLVFGYLIDRTGSWTLPFAGSIGLLLLGAGLAFRMHPDRPFAAGVVVPT